MYALYELRIQNRDEEWQSVVLKVGFWEPQGSLSWFKPVPKKIGYLFFCLFVFHFIFSGNTTWSVKSQQTEVCGRICGRISKVLVWKQKDAALVGWGDAATGDALVTDKECYPPKNQNNNLKTDIKAMQSEEKLAKWSLIKHLKNVHWAK